MSIILHYLYYTEPVRAVSRRPYFQHHRQGCSCQIYGRYGVSALIHSRTFKEPETAITRRTASKTYCDLATGTRSGAGKALNWSDDFDLTGPFRRAFSLSVPPLTLYRNYRSSGYSNLSFGVPLVDPTANQYDAPVPNVIRMCVAEVEKRGLNANKIYLVSHSTPGLVGIRAE